MYDPNQVRFIQPDLLGIAGKGFNLYEAFGNNPINYQDAFGLRWVHTVIRGIMNAKKRHDRVSIPAPSFSFGGDAEDDNTFAPNQNEVELSTDLSKKLGRL